MNNEHQRHDDKIIERLSVTMYGDPEKEDSIGMEEKVDAMYEAFTKTLTIKDFIVLVVKLLVGGGGAVIAWSALTAFFFHK